MFVARWSMVIVAMAAGFSMCSHRRKTLPEDVNAISFRALECEER